jgi:hypothetical protein
MRPTSLTWLAPAVVALLFGACGGRIATASPGPGVPGDLPLVGTWVTTITKADLTAAGVTDPGLQNENSGRFTWTFVADGTWTSVQQSLDSAPLNSPISRGTYTVSGGTFVAVTLFPEEYRDKGLHYTWSVDGAGLHLDVLDPPDPMLPVVVETHPWTRSG